MDISFDNMTKNARQAIELAYQHAVRRQSLRVEPEHLLLGVLGAPTTIIDGQQPGLGFSADGVALAVAYSDRDGRAATLDLYDLAPDRLVQVACATAGRDLTAAEWRQFVNDAVPDDLRCTR